MKSVMFLIACVCLAGCVGKTSEQKIEPPKASSSGTALRIAVIPKGTTHEFWKSVEAGALEAGKELGVEVIWKGPLKEDNRDEQIKVVEDFVNQKVSGIVLAPLDDTALRMPVNEAQTAGIPVVIFDSALKEVKTVSFVATDNFAAGKMGGARLVELLGPDPKKVIVLRYQEGSASTTERENGALEALRAMPHLTIVSDNQYAGATVESAQKAAENLINRFKGADGAPGFDGVFCPNESSAFGMLRALQDAGLAGKIRFVGFDASSKLVEALEKGEVDALVVQNPHKMGYLGVKSIVAHLKGEKVEERIDTGAVIADKSNMAQPDVAKLIGR